MLLDAFFRISIHSQLLLSHHQWGVLLSNAPVTVNASLVTVMGSPVFLQHLLATALQAWDVASIHFSTHLIFVKELLASRMEIARVIIVKTFQDQWNALISQRMYYNQLATRLFHSSSIETILLEMSQVSKL